MKQHDLKPCANCGHGMMHGGQPFFYRAVLTQMVINLGAVRRQHGLEMMMGGAATLAQAMGLNEDMAKPMAETTVLICADCAMDPSQRMPVALFMDDDTPETPDA